MPNPLDNFGAQGNYGASRVYKMYTLLILRNHGLPDSDMYDDQIGPKYV